MQPGRSYQDAVIRDVLLHGAIALAFTIMLVICLACSKQAREILEPLPISRSGYDYVMVVATLGVLAVIWWAVPLGMLFTTPEQHDRLASKQSPALPKRKRPYLWPDVTDPDYRTPVWRYWLSKRR